MWIVTSYRKKIIYFPSSSEPSFADFRVYSAILCTSIGEGLAKFIGPGLNLTTLCLGCCYHLTDRGLCHLLRVCGTNLHALDLELTCIKGDGLVWFRESLLLLTTLKLRDCKNLTDKGYSISDFQTLKKGSLEDYILMLHILNGIIFINVL